ncbi:hypothetical protein BZA77DRAFT_251854 [Pyronema omphalodes]|nr:hypothetical protein BZA77DRAFT_251854 [Pyronema omphalodes]
MVKGRLYSSPAIVSVSLNFESIRWFYADDVAVLDTHTVISEFNDLVNMDSSSLSSWLKTSASEHSGQQKKDGSHETIGHDSGRHIVRILQKNPDKDPSKYDEEDIQHMRKVVSYCKRHLAQEETAKHNTDSKSYKSLKNWGHDAQLE